MKKIFGTKYLLFNHFSPFNLKSKKKFLEDSFQFLKIVSSFNQLNFS
jgi:hypothetical protein